MPLTSQHAHQTWSSRFTFVLATIGFSVGLGNVWRFPYLAGESGGGAFVLIYLFCVMAIGLPVVVAELMIGRRGGMTPARSLFETARAEGRTGAWAAVGGLAMLTGFLILSFYAVIGGWTLHYLTLSARGAWSAADAAGPQAAFDALLADPGLLMFWQGAFLALNALVVSGGVRHGIERAVVVLMPLLFVLLTALAVYGLVAGDAARGLAFLFKPDFSQVTARTWIDAVGQAFFSVGVGMAAMMTYGAYLPKHVHIPGTAAVISFADTLVALIAGVAIFPFVFQYGLEPTEGPGLVFVTLPAAFSDMPGGGVVAVAFFALLAVAALTSSIALFEVLVSWGEERGWPRPRTAVVSAAACWLTGLLTVVSFNVASDFHPLAFTPGFETATTFDIIDWLTSKVGLPLGGLLLAVFAGWAMSAPSVAEELNLRVDGPLFRAWRFLIRWPVSLAILAMIVAGAAA